MAASMYAKESFELETRRSRPMARAWHVRGLNSVPRECSGACLGFGFGLAFGWGKDGVGAKGLGPGLGVGTVLWAKVGLGLFLAELSVCSDETPKD
eukprot:scaffold10178_cov129-Isochrysis_galbana.AAC.1